VLPIVFEDRLPKTGGKGYEAFGMIYEKDANGKTKALPVGVMQRRNMGIDRVFVNCAVCHHSTYRTALDQPPQLVLGMPSARFDLGAFENFLIDIVTDERFDKDYLVPAIEKESGGLSVIDKYLIYPIAISLMRDRLMMLRNRFSPMKPGNWGPGRVDTFNSAKALFNFPFHNMEKYTPHEMVGVADFPSIWNQGPREGMQLHWDGNNCRVEERNKSAAFGTGTTPATIDLASIARIEKWLNDGLKPPPWPERAFPINKALAEQGKAVYLQHCASCHGNSATDFTSKCTNPVPQKVAIARCEMQGADVPYGDCAGQVTKLENIGTDPYRLYSYTYDLAANQSLLYAPAPYRFRHFRKTYGYANVPLDGIWIRGPYLHNGSVPTLADLLKPAAARPKSFYRGFDVIDPVNVGFVGNVASQGGIKFWPFCTHDPKTGLPIPGNDNSGHEYGASLQPAEKTALLEHLKTF
jgi:mono/diheme cytochrome c family protein